MGFKLADLYATVRTDGTQLDRNLDRHHAKLSRLQAKLDGLATFALRWGMVFGAAIGAGLIYSMKAAADQEKAEEDLIAALDAHGESGRANIEMLKARAAAIQKQTVYGDEMILGLMAQATNLGVTSDKLDQTARNSIGLSKALGIDLNSALKYGTLALQGEFTMLSRYIPALRTAKTAAEKMAIVQGLMNAGYQQAQAEIETSTGKLKQMKNTLGDAAEVIGASLLPAVANAASAFKNWLDGPGGTDAVKELKDTIEDLSFAVFQGPAAKAILSEIAQLEYERGQAISLYVQAISGNPMAILFNMWQRDLSVIDADLGKAHARLANLRAAFDEETARQQKKPPSTPRPVPTPEEDWGPDLGPFAPYPKAAAVGKAAADPVEAMMDRVRKARDVFSGVAGVARGMKVDMLKAMGFDLEAEKARIDNWLADQLAAVEAARSRLAELGVRLTAEQETAFGAMEDMARRQAAIEKGALGKKAKPEITIRLASMEDWLAELQRGVMPKEDTAKRHLAATETTNTKLDEAILVLETLQVGLQ